MLLNFCVNARDAMPAGGRLRVSAENISLDAHYAGMNLEARPGPHVVIKVEDSGMGMTREVIPNIFDPFFTTKDVGKGTGLGLSTSLAIVKSHDGFIRVYSEVGKGTKFEIYLPALTGAADVPAVEAVAEIPRGNGELILVVDDEARMRAVAQRTLEAFGYRVVIASDGAEAVTVFAERGLEIALVLTDMTMPVMDGPATIHVMQRMHPEVPIIATSGLSDSGQVAFATVAGVSQFLPKPYTAETLLRAVHEVLAKSRRR